jgi:hypothetical protein
MAASIYDKLSALCEEIEIDILAREGSEKAQRDALGELKDRAYLDRSPEAEHATQLYRRFRDVAAASKGGSGVGAPLDGTIAGAAHYLSQKPRPLYYVNEVTEGTSEELVGFVATNTHIFRLRAAIAFQMLLGFLFIACNHYVAQGHGLTADYMLSTLCPAKASAITGTFDMRLFQFNAALAFFVFFLNFCFCTYYVLPVDDSGRKYVFYYTILLPTFLVCDVSVCLSLSIYSCLPAFSDTTWHESNHHSLPSINH